MQEVFEKIIERLEEKQEKLDTDMWAKQCDNWYGERQNGVSEGIDIAIEIVNQVAEEYGGSELHNAKNIYDYIQTQINPYGKPFNGTVYEFGLKVMDYIESLTNNNQSLTNDGWIPFTLREADVEEKEIFGCETMLDCKLPEDGEEIFVTHKFKDKLYVCGDTFMRDGSECYLESGLEFVSEAIAWCPLPEPYRGE